MNIKLSQTERFEDRHNGSGPDGIAHMLKTVGANSLDALIDQTIPANIRLKKALNLPAPKGEYTFLQDFKKLASRNKLYRSYIGQGYYGTITPGVIQRNILENPGWYTAYTPYQAEIAQGRLEALINFQTLVMDLTGMEIANASLLDEGTAAAEAMGMFYALRKGSKKDANRFFVDRNTFLQTLDILQTRAEPMGIELVIGELEELDLEDGALFGMLLQYPNKWGNVQDLRPYIDAAHEKGILVGVAADLMALTLLTPPGEMGADVVVGTTQRFGVPMGYGGPHAAYFATKDEFKRLLPGRIIGVSKDAAGNPAYRMALQTREQHIRREKATSNICTAQVLLAVMAGMYAVYHGPQGLKQIAGRINGYARLINTGLELLGYKQLNKNFFDTLAVELETPQMIEVLRQSALSRYINFNYRPNSLVVTLSLDETVRMQDAEDILAAFAEAAGKQELALTAADVEISFPENLQRTSAFLEHEVFNSYHIEHEMLRYIKRLENRDLSLVHSMISLGSCTMKLNATAEMKPVTWPEWGNLHPFVPADQAQGYRQLFSELEAWLSEITGFAAVSLQPNSGAQGEYAGLMVIRAYHQHRGDSHRDVCLIPSSAHGTNPASAAMAGLQIVIVKCDERGNIDVADLKARAQQYSDRLSCLMVTYPSTHGVFEESIIEICDTIHQHGGQVYMDGANMNAQVGLTSPANIGADVCHLNLHKTFCIPHGGGGPGMGPIGVAKHLQPFLPGSPMVDMGNDSAITAVSAAPWGSASILTISHAYISMMGPEGLTQATRLAILNANYIKARLSEHYKILYTNNNGRCAHEMIVDCREFKKAGVEVEDIAKRLMDYGFHAPTVSFPVAGTLMIEPTESESVAELDRFCDALISIREEIREVESGQADAQQNVLKNAPHTAQMIMSSEWNQPYSREKAAYPLPYTRESKFWPSVRRVDSAYGDRNLMCSCIPVSAYEEQDQQAEINA
ncbi:aminomethyl-transferring glycine dehydrogenase [Cesiribacter sp. SM1]|uniref:aminomethyl-transferring glycine dehydrogenase n=1 Tax=Cesiribacter sp. SM1 TaxID=2861196 RepID=UPI001CD2F5CA|nr:aminomethyl-transferring glycine dehydrogenase [Cesiribacter sp. SM1]